MSTDNVFPIRQSPSKAGDDTLETYFDIAQQITREHAKALLADPGLGEVLDTKLGTVPDLFFSTKKRHAYAFERVPYGRVMGWRCYDANKYDGDPADGDTSCGYGKTEDEAYADYIGYERPATAAERELDEAIDSALGCGRDGDGEF